MSGRDGFKRQCNDAQREERRENGQRDEQAKCETEHDVPRAIVARQPDEADLTT